MNTFINYCANVLCFRCHFMKRLYDVWNSDDISYLHVDCSRYPFTVPLRTRCPLFSELMPPLNERIRAYQLAKCLFNFEHIEDEFQDLTARFIECPSSPSCSDDVECDYCKTKWLLEEGDLE